MEDDCANCPTCQALRASGIPPAPNSKHRHPASHPKQQVRRELTQCQTCFKSKADGATLFKCSACKVDLYCSKECQKKAWQTHKVKCKINQRLTNLAGDDVAPLVTELRAFTSKHRPSIAQAGVRALRIDQDPSRCQRDLLVIYLMSRPGRKRSETAFYATGTDIRSYDHYGEKGIEMREQLAMYAKQNKKTGAVATFFVMLHCLDTSISNIAPVGAWRDVLEHNYRGNWEAELLGHLNEGIVL